LKNRHIFIDFENVQPKDLALLKGRDFKVVIFVGATQAKLPTEFAIAVQALGPAAEYVQIDGSGRNALDFHIAYYLGSTSAASASGESFVISKDTGFYDTPQKLDQWLRWCVNSNTDTMEEYNETTSKNAQRSLQSQGGPGGGQGHSHHERSGRAV
jgi:hypothetical protein